MVVIYKVLLVVKLWLEGCQLFSDGIEEVFHGRWTEQNENTDC